MVTHPELTHFSDAPASSGMPFGDRGGRFGGGRGDRDGGGRGYGRGGRGGMTMLGRDKVRRSPGPAILRHMRPALPDCNSRFPSIGFTFVFATISPPSIRPVPQSKGRTMATAMKLSVPKPVNLPSMKKVRPRPDALTRNQRRSALFPVTNGGTRPRPEDDPRSRATVFTIAGALRERS